MAKKALFFIIILVIILCGVSALAQQSPDFTIVADPPYYLITPLDTEQIQTFINSLGDFSATYPVITVRDLPQYLQDQLLEAFPDIPLNAVLNDILNLTYIEPTALVPGGSGAFRYPLLASSSIMPTHEHNMTQTSNAYSGVITLRGITTTFPEGTKVATMIANTNPDCSICRNQQGQCEMHSLSCHLDHDHCLCIHVTANTQKSFTLVVFSDFGVEPEN